MKKYILSLLMCCIFLSTPAFSMYLDPNIGPSKPTKNIRLSLQLTNDVAPIHSSVKFSPLHEIILHNLTVCSDKGSPYKENVRVLSIRNNSITTQKIAIPENAAWIGFTFQLIDNGPRGAFYFPDMRIYIETFRVPDNKEFKLYIHNSLYGGQSFKVGN